MGLIKALKGAVKDTFAEQWKEFFYCGALPANVLITKGQKRTGSGSQAANTKGSDNVISNGSVIAVADGQCMIIVEQGKVVELCAEPGEFTYDSSTEPSILNGSLSESIPGVFKSIGKRFTFGGETGKDQRVYYFNTKEIMGNRFGTSNPIPFRVVDTNIGLDMDISIQCYGEYSYRITNPMLFYTNVTGNVDSVYKREQIDSQLKSEFIDALRPAFGKISAKGIRYTSLMAPETAEEFSLTINEVLSKKWSELRGIEVISFAFSNLAPSDEDQELIKDLQRTAVMGRADMAAGTLVMAQAEAMKSAAANQNAGPAMAFMGMNMAANAGGINAQSLFQMSAQQKQQEAAAQHAADPAPVSVSQQKQQDGWICSCGNSGNTGKYCTECAKPRPEQNGWSCSCGTVNKGRFCMECGKPKPAGVPQYKCDKCGWEPSDPSKPPKYCPECGDPFDDGDLSN